PVPATQGTHAPAAIASAPNSRNPVRNAIALKKRPRSDVSAPFPEPPNHSGSFLIKYATSGIEAAPTVPYVRSGSDLTQYAIPAPALSTNAIAKIAKNTRLELARPIVSRLLSSLVSASPRSLR